MMMKKSIPRLQNMTEIISEIATIGFIWGFIDKIYRIILERTFYHVL